jgi:glycosyltransferase involved in cell wall biosynthesis
VSNKLPISLVTIVHNASGRLRNLIEKHRDVVSEVIVVDQFSTDGTYEEAQELADIVFQRRCKGTSDPDRNWAFGMASQPYVLYLDDDECLTDETKALLSEILAIQADAFWLKRDNYVDGVDIKEISGDDIQCRLFKRGAVRFPSRIHKYPEAAQDIRVVYLDCAIRHDRGYDQMVQSNRSREIIANPDEKKLQDSFMDKVTDYLKTGLRPSR